MWLTIKQEQNKAIWSVHILCLCGFLQSHHPSVCAKLPVASCVCTAHKCAGTSLEFVLSHTAG